MLFRLLFVLFLPLCGQRQRPPLLGIGIKPFHPLLLLLMVLQQLAGSSCSKEYYFILFQNFERIFFILYRGTVFSGCSLVLSRDFVTECGGEIFLLSLIVFLPIKFIFYGLPV